MVQGKWFAPGTDLSALLPIRSAVFGTEADSLDAACWNVLVYEDSVPAATGRIWWEDGAYRLGDIGVLESYRSQRLGDLVLRLLLFKAQSHAAKEVRLQSPRDVAGFFARLGLKEESVDDTGLVEMMIPGEDIDLDTCRHCPKASCPNRK
jgi:predicted GNAT family N-acyltransferase